MQGSLPVRKPADSTDRVLAVRERSLVWYDVQYTGIVYIGVVTFPMVFTWVFGRVGLYTMSRFQHHWPPHEQLVLFWSFEQSLSISVDNG